MEKKEFLSSLVEHALEMVLVFDGKGTLSYANAEAREKLGYGGEKENIHISNIFPMIFTKTKEGFSTEYAFERKTETVGVPEEPDLFSGRSPDHAKQRRAVCVYGQRYIGKRISGQRSGPGKI